MNLSLSNGEMEINLLMQAKPDLSLLESIKYYSKNLYFYVDNSIFPKNLYINNTIIEKINFHLYLN